MTQWVEAKVVPGTSVVHGGVMLIAKSGECIGQVLLLNVKDRPAMTEAVHRALVHAADFVPDGSASHNAVTREALTQLVRGTAAAGGKDSDIMVAAESLLLGLLLINEKQFGVSRAVSAERLESLTQAVLERLAKEARP